MKKNKFLLLIFLASYVFANDSNELLKTNKEIASLQKEINIINLTYNKTQSELAKSDKEIANLNNQMQELEEQIADVNDKIFTLQNAKQVLENKIKEKQEAIKQHIKNFYIHNNNSQELKLFLDNQNLQEKQIILTYQAKIFEAGENQINEFNSYVEDLKQAEMQIVNVKNQQEEQKHNLSLQAEKLALIKQENKATLQKLKQEQQTKAQILQNEKARKNELERTIALAIANERKRRILEENKIREQQANVVQNNPYSKPKENVASLKNHIEQINSQQFALNINNFANTKGKLPKPVNGNILKKFGSVRGDDERITWDGMLIAANEGTRVRAVFDGKVIFADYLRGTGFLIILDHGNSHLSLYGHNQNLLKKNGDYIKAGDAIATVGKSGGLEESALYFGIRINGQAVNPAHWLR